MEPSSVRPQARRIPANDMRSQSTSDLPEDAQAAALAEARRLAGVVIAKGTGRAAAIAAALNIPIEVKRMSSDGRLLREGGRYRMLIREGQSSSRSNFSICHELGHALVDQVRSDSSESETIRGERSATVNQAWEERFCDRLAAEMLMPDAEVCRLVAREQLVVASTFAVAREFGVSAQAALIRVVEVQRDPCVLSCWCPGDTTSKSALRLGWVARNPAAPHVGRHDGATPPRELEQFWATGSWISPGPRSLRLFGGRAASAEFIRIGRSTFAKAYAILRGFCLRK